MKRDSQSPEHYIKSIEGEQKILVEGIRKLIFEVDPDAEEVIEYGMLGYVDFANLAAQKNYVSLYVSPKALTEHKNKHPEVNCGKSCLRFSSLKKFDPASVKALLKDVMDRRERGEDMGCC